MYIHEIITLNKRIKAKKVLSIKAENIHLTADLGVYLLKQKKIYGQTKCLKKHFLTKKSEQYRANSFPQIG